MDSTALERQNRRIERLKKQGVSRATILVHDECKPVLNGLKSHLLDPVKAKALTAILSKLGNERKPINVAQVRQLSPFRYPGGKTWLVPEVREWLSSLKPKPSVFVEPFAGGAMAGLTAAAEGLAQRVMLCELDEDVAAVWKVIFSGPDQDIRWLCKRILAFRVTLPNVLDVLAASPKTNRERAFRTVVKNRMQRGGIMAPGAGLIKSGEAGRGLKSRWYPETIAKRIEVLRGLRRQISIQHGDAMEMINKFAKDPDACFFVDPPYTAGGKKAGKRLYTHNEINHEDLFKAMASVRGSVMLTYDDTLEVRNLAAHHNFRIRSIPMKNTHHEVMRELLILKP